MTPEASAPGKTLFLPNVAISTEFVNHFVYPSNLTFNALIGVSSGLTLKDPSSSKMDGGAECVNELKLAGWRARDAYPHCFVLDF